MPRDAAARIIASEVTDSQFQPGSELRGKSARSRGGMTRSEFVRAAAVAGMAATELAWPVRARAAAGPRVVIIGAGLAGLRCADVLWHKHGIRPTVYEWDGRVGGRCETLHGYFAGGQTAEMHAEFISSEHTMMRALVKRFGLKLFDENALPAGLRSTYWFDGKRYTQADLNADWRAWGWKLFHHAVNEAPWPTRSDKHNSPTARAWDAMSVPEWIEAHVPGGLTHPFGKMLIQDVIDEYGGDPDDQSALNAVYLLGYYDSVASGVQPKSHPMLSGTDERYHINGGNDQIVSGLMDGLPDGTVHLHQRLVGIRQRSGGGYRLSLSSDSATHDVTADHVVLALPFATLRDIDLSHLDLPPAKRRAIDTLGMGTNCKVQLQFTHATWESEHYDGTFYADTGAQSGWQAAPDPPGAPPIITEYLGAARGRNLGPAYNLSGYEGEAPRRLVDDTIARIEPIFPGIRKAWNGRSWFKWSYGDPHIKGGYSYYRVGQFTGISGAEGPPVGALHFAGEHTAPNYQGYLEGAVRSGRRCAAEIASTL